MDEREYEIRRKIRQRKLRAKRRRQREMRRLLALIGILLIMILCVWFACSHNDKENKAKETLELQKTQDNVVEKYVEPEINLVMVGDILLHDNVQESGALEDGTYNYDHLFENVKEDIEEADIAIANQEVILGGTEIGLSGYPSFNGAYEVGDALAEAGFNVILHATNHTLDRGKTALLNCMNFWKEKHGDIAVLGIFETQEAHDNEIYIFEQGGMKIAILNYTYGTNGITMPDDMPYAVAMLEEEKVLADLEKANKIADFVIVCPHWGTEYQHEQSEEQERWAKIFMENGVDLVIGTHPHYIQPIEMLSDENGNQMLTYYSLGNFINSTSDTGRGTADRMIGSMAKVTIAKKESGEVYVKEYGVEPLVTQLLYGKQEITTYKLSDYTEELAAQNKITEKDAAFNLAFCKELCTEVFGELY